MLLLWCQIVLLWHQVIMVASEQHLFQTIVQFDKTIILPRKLATGSVHDYLFHYCPLVGILFEVRRILTTFLHTDTVQHFFYQIKYNFHGIFWLWCVQYGMYDYENVIHVRSLNSCLLNGLYSWFQHIYSLNAVLLLE